MNDITTPSKEPNSWVERIRSYPKGANALWDVSQALTELREIGQRITHVFDHHSGLPDVLESQLRQIIAEKPGQYPYLEDQLARDHHPIIGFKKHVYDTGYEGACAFDNEAPYAPVSILVCPTTREYLNFDHFFAEAPPEEQVAFMQAVRKVANDAIRAYDESVDKRPEAAEKRAHYEELFNEIRSGKLHLSKEQMGELGKEYAQDSLALKFAVRDPITGTSGYRIVLNNGTGSSGMSQPHLHAQIVGGRYLGGITVPNPAQSYSNAVLSKLSYSLSR